MKVGKLNLTPSSAQQTVIATVPQQLIDVSRSGSWKFGHTFRFANVKRHLRLWKLETYKLCKSQTNTEIKTKSLAVLNHSNFELNFNLSLCSPEGVGTFHHLVEGV